MNSWTRWVSMTDIRIRLWLVWVEFAIGVAAIIVGAYLIGRLVP